MSAAIMFFAHLIQAVLAARDSLRIAIQVMSALEMELDNKLNYLLALYTHMHDVSTRMKQSIETTAAVTLNLRGTLFIIETEHLTASSNIFFHTLTHSDPDPSRGHYFIDRPSEGFNRIVNSIRGEEISYEGLNEYELQCIEENLKYFHLPSPRFRRVFKESQCMLDADDNDGDEVYITFACALQDNRLCTGFSDGIIRIWDTSTLPFQYEMELLSHSTAIHGCLQLESGKLCSISYDMKIKLWNLSSVNVKLH
jgi:WD40 repeat protein